MSGAASRVRGVCVLLLSGLLGLPAAAETGGADPFRAYLESHPGTSEEDLLDVAPGDPLDRVLAVVHHPDLGVDPEETSLHRIDGVALEQVVWADGPVAGPVEVQCSAHGAPRAATVEGDAGDALVAVRFAARQRRVAAGQSVVLYAGDEVVGGGIAAAPVRPL